MNRRAFLRGISAGAAAVALGGCDQGQGAAQRPNVVFILTDDQRWDQMSCAGHPYLKTPHLDRIASEGVYFENMFVTTSLCSPSRASFLSGLYAHTHGVTNNFTDYPARMTSWPARLHQEGYETAYIGKWHMGEKDDSKRPGFDYWISHSGQGKYFDNTWNINGKREVRKGYYTANMTDMALDWLRKGRGKPDAPFALIIGHKAAHTPFTPEPKYDALLDGMPVEYPKSAFALDGKPDWVKDRIDTWHGIYGPIYGFREKFPDNSPESVKDFARFSRSYSACIKSVDDSVGRVYTALKELGLLENTLIVFAGDNGMFLGEHGMTDKRTMHEESIRVPLLARLPGGMRAGTRVAKQVLNIDLAPSVLEICGAKPLANIHGKSWARLVAGDESNWRSSWYYEYNYEKQFPYTPNVRGVRTDEWKYVHYPHGDGKPDRHKAELYNLKRDPGEATNLIDDPKCADIVIRLKEELAHLLRETGALPDKMPIDEGVKKELPEESIR